MTTSPLPFQTLAAGLTRILSFFIAAVVSQNDKPRLVRTIPPLWHHLSRIIHRFERLMARLAAGLAPWPSRPGRPNRAHQPPKYRLRPRDGWVVIEFGRQMVIFTGQLTQFLAQPEMVELLATVPQAARIIRPLCQMLGVHPYKLPEPPAPKPPVTPPPPPPPPERPPQEWFPHLSRAEQVSRLVNFLKSR